MRAVCWEGKEKIRSRLSRPVILNPRTPSSR